MSQSEALENLYTEELYKIPPRVLVVISKPWEDVSEDERAVLAKMLVAVKLNLAAVQILFKKEFAVDELIAHAPTKVLAFGSNLKTPAKHYDLISIGSVSVILSESLDMLDDTKKKSLWLALKLMFAL